MSGYFMKDPIDHLPWWAKVIGILLILFIFWATKGGTT